MMFRINTASCCGSVREAIGALGKIELALTELHDGAFAEEGLRKKDRRDWQNTVRTVEHERDAVIVERDEARAERDEARAERDALRRRRERHTP